MAGVDVYMTVEQCASCLSWRLTWVMSQGGKSPQHILNALRSELAQLVHQLALQHLEQHGAGVVVQGGKCPQRVGDVLAVEVLQPLHGL